MRRLSPLVLASCALLSGCASLLPTLRVSALSRRSQARRGDERVRHRWYGRALVTTRWTLGSPPRPPTEPSVPLVEHGVLAGRLPCQAFCMWERQAVRSAR